jgi:uncharacterized protein DUF4112
MNSRMASAGAIPGRPAHRVGTRARIETIARLLDSAWRVPGTNIRLGADPALNLLPGVGLIVSKGISAYLIWEAHRLGAPFGILIRMIGNLALDAVISAVPMVGWVGDVFYRANLRNVRLLREHLDRHDRLGQQCP